MNYALTAYPLSRDYQDRLEKSLGSPINYLLLAELRQLPLPELFKKLRTLNADYLLLPLEDINSQALLPILKTVALLAKAKVVEVVTPDLQRTPTNLWHTLIAIVGVSTASLMAQFARIRTAKEIQKLLNCDQSNKGDQPVAPTVNNVLYINGNLWFGVKAGGSVGHIAGVINALAEQQFNMHYAAVDHSSLIDASVKLTTLQPPKFFGVPAEANYYRFNLQTIKQLLKHYQQLPFKFIYQRMSIANYAGVALSRSKQIPLILEYNGSEAWIAKNWGRPLRYHDLAVQIEDVCLKHAHLIVTISDALRDELIERGVNKERIISYPNCIDPKMFNPENFDSESRLTLRQRHGIDPDAIVLTFVGTFGMWHGVDVLAKTIRRLIEREEDWLIKHKIHFLLVGDGAKMAEVKQILGDKLNKTYLTLTGLIPQHEAPRYLAASDILLSPHVANADGSRFFGSPTKLFEYMAMGKAIVASDLEQIGEVLNNSLRATALPSSAVTDDISQLAVLCKPGDVDELIAAIHYLAEQPAWRNKLGMNARQEALTKYTWTQHVNAFLEKLPS